MYKFVKTINKFKFDCSIFLRLLRITAYDQFITQNFNPELLFSEPLNSTWCVALSGLNPGQDEIDEMIEETDKDHSGAIDFR